MDINLIKTELSQNKAIFELLFQTFQDKDAQLWKASEGKWCALEIICHLYDEEREDFRARIKHILTCDEDLPWPGINPEGWVKERNYISRSYDEMLNKFLQERTASIIYLENLKDANWQKKFVSPASMEVDPLYFLKNWLAHDYLHMRQLFKLKYDYLSTLHKYIRLDYAGIW